MIKLSSIYYFLYLCLIFWNIYSLKKLKEWVGRQRTEGENFWQKQQHERPKKEGRAQSVQEIQSRSVELKLEEGMLTNRRWCKVGKELRPEITRQIIIRKLLRRV